MLRQALSIGAALFLACSMPQGSGSPLRDGPIAAQLEALGAADPALRFSAGLAACLIFPARLPELVERAVQAGYDRAEWGALIDLVRDDTRLLLSPVGGFCEVSSEILTIEEAAERLGLLWR